MSKQSTQKSIQKLNQSLKQSQKPEKSNTILYVIIAVVLLSILIGGGYAIYYYLLKPVKYACKDGVCVEDKNGKYNTLAQCTDKCKKHKCDEGVCKEDSEGEYPTLDDCQSKCEDKTLGHKCQNNTCVRDTATPPQYANFNACKLDGCGNSTQDCEDTPNGRKILSGSNCVCPDGFSGTNCTDDVQFGTNWKISTTSDGNLTIS
jgi:hypothetical protein